MSGPAKRRAAGLGTFLLILSMLVVTTGGIAAAVDEHGGQYEPPAGCIKLEEEGTPRVGVDGSVVVGEVTVTFTWIPKEGEPGEWIGFTWVATGGTAGGTVKAGLVEYPWGPATSGTFTVPEEGGIVHAISFVIVCPGEIPQPEPAAITIEKVTVGGLGTFGFEFGGETPLGFSLTTTGPGSAGKAVRVFDDLEPGEYMVREVQPLPTGWVLQSITCDGEPVAGAEGFEPSGVVIDLEAGDDITCTFTNVNTPPTTPATTPTTLPTTVPTLGTTIPVSVLPTTVLAPQQEATTTLVATLPFTGAAGGVGLATLATSLAGLGAMMVAVGTSRGRS